VTIASTSAIQIAHITEATWGTTPATPEFQILRKTGDSLSIERENVKSSETRLDRNITDLIQVGGGASGGIDFEMSYGTLDDFLESAMHSTWGSGSAADPDKVVATTDMANGVYSIAAQPATPAKITVTRTVAGSADTPGIITITGTDSGDDAITEDIVPGATGVTVSGNKTFKTVSLVVGSGWTSDGTADTITVGVAAVGTVIKNGSTPKSFTLEKKIPCGATTEYLRYTGMEVNELSLSVKAKEIVTGSMSFIGKGGTVAQAIANGATYVDPNDNDVMNAAAHFASLTVGGVSNPHIQGIELSVNNNLRAASAVGSVDSLGIGYGRFEVSGSMDVYFEDTTLYSLFLAGTAASLTFTIGGTTGEKYTFLVPNLKFETATTDSGGNDEDMMCKLGFSGLYDATEGCTLSITRAVA
jgi:hypothetical protein